LGAFTTFSTFGSETMALFSQGKDGLAFLNVGMHLILGLVSVQGGRLLTNLIWQQVA
jgi:fluoride ion exporter CrcB/FEX